MPMIGIHRRDLEGVAPEASPRFDRLHVATGKTCTGKALWRAGGPRSARRDLEGIALRRCGRST
jgi:hypothetical protein